MLVIPVFVVYSFIVFFVFFSYFGIPKAAVAA